MTHFHLYAIGNALVDSEYEVSEELLNRMGVEKRRMTLIDGSQRAELLQHVDEHALRRTGGGSAGNTAVAMAQLGGKAFYSCRVSDDELGQFFALDLDRNGVATNLSHTKAPHGQTGSCMVFVTPDAERSMCTFLGATADLDATSLHPKDIAKSRVYYMEGYLSASHTGLAAALEGKILARKAGGDVAVTLSDVSMINFCREGLEAMLNGGVDHLFCNEEEARAWCGSDDMVEVEKTMTQLADTVCITHGPKGCVVLHQGNRWAVPAPAVKALDANGAGDMFAGAFLYGITHGYNHEMAALLANRCAAAVVSQHGNRLTPEKVRTLKVEFELEAHLTA